MTESLKQLVKLLILQLVLQLITLAILYGQQVNTPRIYHEEQTDTSRTVGTTTLSITDTLENSNGDA